MLYLPSNLRKCLFPTIHIKTTTTTKQQSDSPVALTNENK